MHGHCLAEGNVSAMSRCCNTEQSRARFQGLFRGGGVEARPSSPPPVAMPRYASQRCRGGRGHLPVVPSSGASALRASGPSASMRMQASVFGDAILGHPRSRLANSGSASGRGRACSSSSSDSGRPWRSQCTSHPRPCGRRPWRSDPPSRGHTGPTYGPSSIEVTGVPEIQIAERQNARRRSLGVPKVC